MKASFILSLVCLISPPVFAQSATVTWTTTHQTMDGWGASTGYNERNPNLNATQADMFFSPTAGIGLEWIRIQDSTNGTTPDLPTLQEAVARGAKVFISFDFSSTGGASSNWASETSYIITKLQYLQSNGVPVAYLSPQNEPGDTPGAWTAAEFDGLISTSLGPGLAAANLTVPIVLGEDSEWFVNDWVTPCMDDSNCSPYVPIVAGHGYGIKDSSVDGFDGGSLTYADTPVPASAAGKRVWMTEVTGGYYTTCTSNSNQESFQPAMSEALVWAHNIHDLLTVANGSAWMYWNLQAESYFGPPSCNDGLTDQSFNPAQRYYVVGNWSKFVRSGWVRIDATANPASGVYVTAFKEASSGSFAIVAINENSSSVNLAVSLAGFPSVASLTPTLTSASVNLVDQATVNVSGSAFSYSLPAASVVTFHGAASSSSPQTPAPPTNLAATVK